MWRSAERRLPVVFAMAGKLIVKGNAERKMYMVRAPRNA